MDSDAILTEMESCWLGVAQAIRRRDSGLGLNRIEASSRWLVELLAFLRIGGQRGVLPGETLDRLDSGDRLERPLGELADSVADQLGEELTWVEPDGANRSARDDASGARIDGGMLSGVLGRLKDEAFGRRVCNAPVEVLGTIHQHLLGKRLRPGRNGGFLIEPNAGRKKAAGRVLYT